MSRRLLFLVGLCAACAAFTQAAQDVARRDAEALEKKLNAIVDRSLLPPNKTPKTPLRTPISEREVNAYLRYSSELPVGVKDPQVVIADTARLEARAIVDLDAVRTSKPRGMFDPVNLLTGTVEVRAAGKLYAANGKGTFALESATLGGVPIPKSLLQELVSYYSRTPESPAGFDLDKPFELPAKVRAVEMQRGAATIVQ